MEPRYQYTCPEIDFHETMREVSRATLLPDEPMPMPRNFWQNCPCSFQPSLWVAITICNRKLLCMCTATASRHCIQALFWELERYIDAEGEGSIRLFLLFLDWATSKFSDQMLSGLGSELEDISSKASTWHDTTINCLEWSANFRSRWDEKWGQDFGRSWMRVFPTPHAAP